jgi:hypothetical protein
VIGIAGRQPRIPTLGQGLKSNARLQEKYDMLVSIQFICIAISLVFGRTMWIGHACNAGWMRFKDGVLRDLMFALVVFTFLLTIVVSAVLRPY